MQHNLRDNTVCITLVHCKLQKKTVIISMCHIVSKFLNIKRSLCTNKPLAACQVHGVKQMSRNNNEQGMIPSSVCLLVDYFFFFLQCLVGYLHYYVSVSFSISDYPKSTAGTAECHQSTKYVSTKRQLIFILIYGDVRMTFQNTIRSQQMYMFVQFIKGKNADTKFTLQKKVEILKKCYEMK